MNATHRKLHLICRGCGDEYERIGFRAISNWFTKPHGGLWASPVNSKNSWIQWCKQEGFEVERVMETSFRFWYEGNILLIDSLTHALEMPWWVLPGTSVEYPDFKAMQKAGIDSIWLTTKGETQTRFSHPRNLYGWDCESILIMNPKGITLEKGKSR